MRHPKVCVYCGAPGARTMDHIPPKALFARPLPDDMITVPACDQCHGSTAMDDEYFAFVVLCAVELGRVPGAESARDRLTRGIAEPPRRRFGMNLLKAMHDIEIRTPSGIIIGKRPGMRVDEARMRKVMTRIIRGLHAKVRGAKLSARAKVGVRLIQSHSYHVLDDLVNARWDLDQIAAGGAFRYQYAALPEEPGRSVWLAGFYQRVIILGVVGGRPEAA
jgi:hypothetical protein